MRSHDANTLFYSGHSLDVNSPIYIGAAPNSIRHLPAATSDLPGYTGCLRNMFINGEVVDFNSPLLQFDVRAGCTRGECNPDPCKNGGKCYGQGDCDCPIEFSGPNCDQGKQVLSSKNFSPIFYFSSSYFSLFFIITESSQVTFLGKDFIQYEVISGGSRVVRKRQTQAYISIANLISFSFLTTEPSGAILQIGDPQASSEYMIVEVILTFLFQSRCMCFTFCQIQIHRFQTAMSK